MTDTQELLQMKEQMVKADKKKAQLEGQLKEQMARLKKEFSCPSTKKGDEKLDKMKDDLDKKEGDLEQGAAKLKRKLEEANVGSL